MNLVDKKKSVKYFLTWPQLTGMKGLTKTSKKVSVFYDQVKNTQ